jgi:hypothetical protein
MGDGGMRSLTACHKIVGWFVGYGLIEASKPTLFKHLGAKFGGDGGIRTLDTPLRAYNGLANRRLQPLGHVSGKVGLSCPELPGHARDVGRPGRNPVLFNVLAGIILIPTTTLGHS